MTSEEIKAAIDRLQVLTDTDIVTALTGEYGWTDKRVREHLIDLLRQADPETHLCVPRDADGVPIQIGDELCGYGRPDGGVYCMATNGAMVYVGEIDEYAPKEWMAWSADQCRHYHKPTVEDVLREYADEVRRCCDTEDTIVEYAAKLREVMRDE